MLSEWGRSGRDEMDPHRLQPDVARTGQDGEVLDQPIRGAEARHDFCDRPKGAYGGGATTIQETPMLNVDPVLLADDVWLAPAISSVRFSLKSMPRSLQGPRKWLCRFLPALCYK